MKDLQPAKKVLLAALAASLLLSLWSCWKDPALNRDATLYVDAAHHLALGDWAESYRLYPWPFYPALIAGLAWLTPFGFEAAGQVLNGLLYAALVLAFLHLLRVAGADARTLLAGALLILIYPQLNEDRADLLRGPGMWAALLLGLACLMRLREEARLRHAFGWCACLLAAALFRIEALAYLAALPLALLFTPWLSWGKRAKACLGCYLPPALALAALALGLHLAGLPLGRLMDPLEHAQLLAQRLTEEIPARGEALTRHVLHDRIEHYGTEGVYAVLGMIAALTFIKRTGLAYLLLAGWAALARRRARTPVAADSSQSPTPAAGASSLSPAAGALPKHGVLLLGALLVNLAYLLLNLVVQFKVSSRYAAPASFVIVLYASFGLAALWDCLQRLPARRALALKSLLALLLLATALDGLHSFGVSKRYLRDAGVWLAAEMPEGQRLVSNSMAVRHYAGVRHTYPARMEQERFENFLKQGHLDLPPLRPGDYLALRPERTTDEVMAELTAMPHLRLIKTFPGDKNRQVLIYRVHPPP